MYHTVCTKWFNRRDMSTVIDVLGTLDASSKATS